MQDLDFQVQSSTEETDWTTLRTVAGGTGGTASYAVSGSGRYVRVYGTARGTACGYSLSSRRTASRSR